MAEPTSIRLSDEAQEALEDLREKLGGKWSKPSVSKTISMILLREIDLRDYPLPQNLKKKTKKDN